MDEEESKNINKKTAIPRVGLELPKTDYHHTCSIYLYDFQVNEERVQHVYGGIPRVIPQ